MPVSPRGGRRPAGSCGLRSARRWRKRLRIRLPAAHLSHGPLDAGEFPAPVSSPLPASVPRGGRNPHQRGDEPRGRASVPSPALCCDAAIQRDVEVFVQRVASWTTRSPPRRRTAHPSQQPRASDYRSTGRLKPINNSPATTRHPAAASIVSCCSVRHRPTYASDTPAIRQTMVKLNITIVPEKLVCAVQQASFH